MYTTGVSELEWGMDWLPAGVIYIVQKGNKEHAGLFAALWALPCLDPHRMPITQKAKEVILLRWDMGCRDPLELQANE